jgi:hypothetical protein
MRCKYNNNMKRFTAIKPPGIIISGAAQNFEKERQKIMEFIGKLLRQN